MIYLSKNYIEQKIISSNIQKRRRISFSSDRYQLEKSKSLQKRSKQPISSNSSFQSLQFYPYTVKNIKSKEKFIIRDRSQHFATLPQEIGRERTQISMQLLERKGRRKLIKEKKKQIKFEEQIEQLKKAVEQVHGSPIDLKKAEKMGVSKKQEFYKSRMRTSCIRIMSRIINRKFSSRLTASFNLINEKAKTKQF